MSNSVSSVAWAAAVFATSVNAACSSFQVVNTPYSERGQSNQVPFLRKAAPPVYRVSPGLVCSDATHTNNCPGNTCSPSVTNGTWLTAPGRSNLTFNTPEDAQSIFALAGTALNINFPWIAGTTMGDPNATTSNTCIPNTVAGYVVFTTNYNCAQGILHCDNGPFPDQTPAQLCAPIVSGSNSQLQGALVVTTAPASAVSTLGAISSTPTPTVTATADGLKAIPTGSGITSSSSPHNVAPTPIGPAVDPTALSTASGSSALVYSTPDSSSTPVGASTSLAASLSPSPALPSSPSSTTMRLTATPSSTGISQSKSAGSALTIQHVSISSFSVYTGTLVAVGTAALAVFL